VVRDSRQGTLLSVPYVVEEIPALAAEASGVENPDFSGAVLGTAEAVP